VQYLVTWEEKVFHAGKTRIEDPGKGERRWRFLEKRKQRAGCFPPLLWGKKRRKVQGLKKRKTMKRGTTTRETEGRRIRPVEGLLRPSINLKKKALLPATGRGEKRITHKQQREEGGGVGTVFPWGVGGHHYVERPRL